MQLGDGATLLGPIDGYFDSGQESFVNTWGNFQFKLGQADLWTSVRGHADTMTSGAQIPLAAPPDVAGNVIIEVFIDSSQVGTEQGDMAGSYAFPNTNRDDRVTGWVEFDAVPAVDVQSVGRYEAILQVPNPLGFNPTLLLGISGCFDVTLLPQG